MSFFTALIDHHTVPGDTVLDIHSGASACASAAFSYGRNCIVIEPDANCAQWINARLRARAASFGTDVDLENEITTQTCELDKLVAPLGDSAAPPGDGNSTAPLGDSAAQPGDSAARPGDSAISTASGTKSADEANGEVTESKCTHCGEQCEVDEDKTACCHCGATLHFYCAKPADDESENLYTCQTTCVQVCIHTLPLKWYLRVWLFFGVRSQVGQ